MTTPTAPAVKGTQPPLSDPQPQRPVSDPRTIIADMLQVITSARRASIGGIQNVYCPQIHVDRVNEWRNALVDLDEAADAEHRSPSPTALGTGAPDVEAYIRSLPWSGGATEDEKALVAGNIRSYHRFVFGPHRFEVSPLVDAGDYYDALASERVRTAPPQEEATPPFGGRWLMPHRSGGCSDNLAPPSDRERANAFAEILHELIRPDNGKCNQCGGHWLYRLDPDGSRRGTWDYFDGEHLPTCIARRVIEARIAWRASRPSTPSSAPTTEEKS